MKESLLQILSKYFKAKGICIIEHDENTIPNHLLNLIEEMLNFIYLNKKEELIICTGFLAEELNPVERRKLIEEAHCSLYGGHCGRYKTIEKNKRKSYLAKIKRGSRRLHKTLQDLPN